MYVGFLDTKYIFYDGGYYRCFPRLRGTEGLARNCRSRVDDFPLRLHRGRRRSTQTCSASEHRDSCCRANGMLREMVAAPPVLADNELDEPSLDEHAPKSRTSSDKTYRFLSVYLAQKSHNGSTVTQRHLRYARMDRYMCSGN
jgi:hypothetical protein